MTADLQTTLSLLQDEFVTHLPERIAALQSLLEAAILGESGALDSFHRAAHNLVGTAGTHGLNKIAESARELEKSTTLSSRSTIDFNALRTVISKLSLQAANPAYNPAPPPPKRAETARIMIVEDDAAQMAWLRIVLEGEGYQVECFNTLGGFRAALQKGGMPAAVIMDMVFPEGDDAGARAIADIRSQIRNDLSVIFLSVRRDIAAKLAAYRAGATRYLTKPIDPKSLLRLISASTSLAPKLPYRVLAVDDSTSQITINALREAGMEVYTETNPLNVLDTLDSFAAEVLLLDMHMPQCTGPELAAMLHDDERYNALPIVYLSAETDVAQQLLALERGGDHFLIKPVNPSHLVSVITMHARRARQCREQSDALQAIRYAQERQRQALEAHSIISETDLAGNITNVSDKFCEISGYTREELVGRNHRIIKSGHHPATFYSSMWETIAGGNIWRGEVCNRAKNGQPYWVSSSIVPFLDENGLPYQYISIRTDITQQKSVELALLDARDAAESASRAKSEFLASMSHELRTPLNAILGFSQLFAMDTALPQSTRNNAREIERAGEHLLSLINDMIDLARIEAGNLSLSMETVQIEKVLKDSLALVETQAANKGIRLIESICPNQKAMVQADHVRLRQVLLNLLTNAIKYNTPHGAVHLYCDIIADQVRLKVTDTGTGIPIDKQGRIFNAFDRLGEERGDIEGTGIGLVITKRIVESMHGTIGFESIPGQGSTFWIEFPLVADAPRHVFELVYVDPPMESISPQKNRPIVLYIEDNPMNWRLMQQVFDTRKNLQLQHTDTAEEGIKLALSLPPALILMDINLPGMDGYTALKILKADERTAHIPVIAITANAMKGDDARGMDSGFQHYLTKPLNLLRLLAILDEMFSVDNG